MQSSYLSSDLVPTFFQLHFPGETLNFYEKHSNVLLRRFETGERSPRDYILVRSDGGPIWSFLIFADGDKRFGVQTPKHLTDLQVLEKEWLSSLELLKARLSELDAKHVVLRFTTAQMTTHLPNALERIGFKKNSDRVEFKNLLKDLPTEFGTPFTWKAVGEKDISIELAAEVLDHCSFLDPNWDPNTSALDSIKNDLDNSELYNKPDSIQIGFLEKKPVAFVFAQVEQSSGWSRLTYMGLAPEIRGQGFGKWVHRHGFEMMRLQGGKEYHGSTTDTNTPMLRTFYSQGCKEYRRVQEWILLRQ